MGNSQLDLGPAVTAAVSVITRYYSELSWIEGAAEQQLTQLLDVEGVDAIAAFPDLHPGKFGPVGVAIRSSRIHPAYVGNDIGCGMALFRLSMPERKLNIEKTAKRLRQLASDDWDAASDYLSAAGLHPSLYSSSLGTVGGGNHFCEVLGVEEVLEGFSGRKGDLFLLVHSGSRGLGEATFSKLDEQRHLGMVSDTLSAKSYLEGHDLCVRWAALNRQAIADRAAELIGCEASLIADVPHNLISYEENRFVHRKGAALARPGDIVPVAGSRDSLSFVVKATDQVSKAFNALSHGAGRKYDRATMRHRVGATKAEREALVRNAWGGRAIVEDKHLLLEEAGAAYKSSVHVVEELVRHGLVEKQASLKPLVTFKRADLHQEDHTAKDKLLLDRRKQRKSKND
jgi:release factor H-coupled RctB family protein